MRMGQEIRRSKWMIAIFFFIFFYPYLLRGGQAESEDYVFVLKIEGGKLFKLIEKTNGEKREWVREEVRRMEILYPDTALLIDEGVSVSLSCAGGNILNLSHKDNPYTIQMTDFTRGRSITRELALSLRDAFLYFIHPDSKPRLPIQVKARGWPFFAPWPPEGVRILSLGEPICFRWPGTRGSFTLEIWEADTKNVIFQKNNIIQGTDVPFVKFKPGKRYVWGLTDERTNHQDQATFELVPVSETIRVSEKSQEVLSLLSREADEETRFRLQAGYLYSQGFTYDSWKLLEAKNLPNLIRD
jgi:hypothetical protein